VKPLFIMLASFLPLLPCAAQDAGAFSGLTTSLDRERQINSVLVIEDGKVIYEYHLAGNDEGPAGRVRATIQDWAPFIDDQLRGARESPAFFRRNAMPRSLPRLSAATTPLVGAYTSDRGQTGGPSPIPVVT
jgi:hypothetical protein